MFTSVARGAKEVLDLCVQQPNRAVRVGTRKQRNSAFLGDVHDRAFRVLVHLDRRVESELSIDESARPKKGSIRGIDERYTVSENEQSRMRQSASFGRDSFSVSERS